MERLAWLRPQDRGALADGGSGGKLRHPAHASVSDMMTMRCPTAASPLLLMAGLLPAGHAQTLGPRRPDERDAWMPRKRGRN